MENRNLKTAYQMFGVECGDGWKGLIQPIFDYIEKYNLDKSEEEKIEILQVKEKFGGLRFYVNFEDEVLSEMIRNAENESYLVCENCGSREDVGHTQGWITTCCFDCATKMAINRKSPIKWIKKDGDSYKKFLIDEIGNYVMLK